MSDWARAAAQFNLGRVALIAGYKFDNNRADPKDGPILEMMVSF